MKKKFFAFATVLMALGMVGCGKEPAPKECETHTFELKQDGDKHYNECTVCGFKEEAKDHSWKKDSSKEDVAATCAADGIAYKICACGATKEEPLAKKTTHTWVDAADQSGVKGATCTAGGEVKQECSVCKTTQIITTGTGLGHNFSAGTSSKNADDKEILTSSCTRCGKQSVSIAFADASIGADNRESSGKLKKGSSFTWKIPMPKAGNVTLQFFIKYGQSGEKLTDEVRETVWGKSGDGQNPYTIKNGETEATVLVNEKQYQETGVTADGAYVDFATFAVTAGENVITFTTPSDQYYRNIWDNNVVLVYAD